MTSGPPGRGESHLNFAKVVAMPPPSKPPSSATPDAEVSSPQRKAVESPATTKTAPDQSETPETQPVNGAPNGLEVQVRNLQLASQEKRDECQPSEDGRENALLNRENSFDDDQTYLSNSSTKPTSFDSKSMASVTTFAMDEKDSLRPDDSASVQAADEDESLSGPASGAPNSLAGSEAGARGYREHVRDAQAQKIRGILPGTVQRFPNGDLQVTGTIPPDAVSNNFVVSAAEAFQSGKPLHGFPDEPDEKLLDAMNSPKDRLFLLQLEEKIRNFIQNSKEQTLELPPSNSFGRLLAHKLGDYYHLTHFVDSTLSSVRLHRTPFCRLPTPLSELRPHSNNTPPPNAPAMKIMRRTDNSGERVSSSASTGPNSAAPSKAASETGAESSTGEDRAGSSGGTTPAKERVTLTREEREAKYQEARERIFRDFPESKPGDTPSRESSTAVSRSSSASSRKRNFRQKTPHDDSFEVRSQYNAWYPGMPYTSGPMPMQMMNNGVHPPPQQQPYMVGPGASPPAMGYSQSPQGPVYAPMNPVQQFSMNMLPPMGQSPPWPAGVPQQPPYPGYQQPPQTRSSPAMNNYAVPSSSQYPGAASPTWGGQPYPGNFSQSPQRTAPVHWPNFPSPAPSAPPYPYGQIPNQGYMPAPNSVAPPMPGSYPRSTFNPQTRSFVPGASNRYPGKAQQGPVNTVNGPQQWSGHQDSGHGSGNSTQNRNHASQKQSSSGSQDSIAKWGTPAHLPPKPPPSKVSPDFPGKGRNNPPPPSSTAPSTSATTTTNASSAPKNNGPLVVSGGSSLSKPN
ncbi:hypothetical protein VTN31DRAFT_6636 [Thermomyces dupontii]|uniref:uncharacterized protein n=1 Tax=Talaromyces thermophilus TaxID=28565 RepID=UPI003744702E